MQKFMVANESPPFVPTHESVHRQHQSSGKNSRFAELDAVVFLYPRYVLIPVINMRIPTKFLCIQLLIILISLLLYTVAYFYNALENLSSID